MKRLILWLVWVFEISLGPVFCGLTWFIYQSVLLSTDDAPVVWSKWLISALSLWLFLLPIIVFIADKAIFSFRYTGRRKKVVKSFEGSLEEEYQAAIRVGILFSDVIELDLNGRLRNYTAKQIGQMLADVLHNIVCQNQHSENIFQSLAGQLYDFFGDGSEQTVKAIKSRGFKEDSARLEYHLDLYKIELSYQHLQNKEKSRRDSLKKKRFEAISSFEQIQLQGPLMIRCYHWIKARITWRRNIRVLKPVDASKQIAA